MGSYRPDDRFGRLEGLYPELRRALAPELAALSDARLSEVLKREYGTEADTLERFLEGLRGVGGQADRLLRLAAPARDGSPASALAEEAIAGEAAGCASTGKRPARGHSRPGVPPTTSGKCVPAATRGVPPVPGRAGGRSAAAGLLGLLADPSLLQALAAMALGSAGRDAIEVNGRVVPVTDFATLLADLARDAVAEQERSKAVRAGGGAPATSREVGASDVRRARPVAEPAPLTAHLSTSDDTGSGVWDLDVAPSPRWVSRSAWDRARRARILREERAAFYEDLED